jgi:hypothetical protein
MEAKMTVATSIETKFAQVTDDQIEETWEAPEIPPVPDFCMSAEELSAYGLSEAGDRALARIYPACVVESGWSRA